MGKRMAGISLIRDAVKGVFLSEVFSTEFLLEEGIRVKVPTSFLPMHRACFVNVFPNLSSALIFIAVQF
jgi:hypothetical protein